MINTDENMWQPLLCCQGVLPSVLGRLRAEGLWMEGQEGEFQGHFFVPGDEFKVTLLEAKRSLVQQVRIRKF